MSNESLFQKVPAWHYLRDFMILPAAHPSTQWRKLNSSSVHVSPSNWRSPFSNRSLHSFSAELSEWYVSNRIINERSQNPTPLPGCPFMCVFQMFCKSANSPKWLAFFRATATILDSFPRIHQILFYDGEKGSAKFYLGLPLRTTLEVY